jgi:hypothetical protein
MNQQTLLYLHLGADIYTRSGSAILQSVWKRFYHITSMVSNSGPIPEHQMFLSTCNFQRNMNAAVRHDLPYSDTHHGKVYVVHV